MHNISCVGVHHRGMQVVNVHWLLERDSNTVLLIIGTFKDNAEQLFRIHEVHFYQWLVHI